MCLVCLLGNMMASCLHQNLSFWTSVTMTALNYGLVHRPHDEYSDECKKGYIPERMILGILNKAQWTVYDVHHPHPQYNTESWRYYTKLPNQRSVKTAKHNGTPFIMFFPYWLRDPILHSLPLIFVQCILDLLCHRRRKSFPLLKRLSNVYFK